MVWAGISCYGKTQIIFIEGWVNNKRYVELLKQARRNIIDMFPGEFYFLQGNARPHVHKHSIRYISRWISKKIKDHLHRVLTLIRLNSYGGNLRTLSKKEGQKTRRSCKKLFCNVGTRYHCHSSEVA